MEQMKKEPKAICENCKKTIHLEPNSPKTQAILQRFTLPSKPSLYPIVEEFTFPEPLHAYPPTLPFWEICKDCRENAACMYDTALLADGLASEYFGKDDDFYTEEFTIEKRWKMNKEEIRAKSEELRQPLNI